MRVEEKQSLIKKKKIENDKLRFTCDKHKAAKQRVGRGGDKLYVRLVLFRDQKNWEVVVKKRTAPIIRRHVGNWIHVSEWCGGNKWTHLDACPDDSSSFRNEVDWSSVFKDVIDWWVQLPCKCCTVPTHYSYFVFLHFHHYVLSK